MPSSGGQENPPTTGLSNLCVGFQRFLVGTLQSLRHGLSSFNGKLLRCSPALHDVSAIVSERDPNISKDTSMGFSPVHDGGGFSPLVGSS